MSDFDLILRGGRVLTSDSDTITDIGIRGKQIAEIGTLSGQSSCVRDCTGLIITPGGVDPHAHIEQMSGMGLMNADTFETASRSALLGATTSVISFAAQAKGQRLVDAMDDYLLRAQRGCAIDYAVHIIVADFDAPSLLDDLRNLIRAGHRSIKIFTTYNIKLDDHAICEVLTIAREEGALVCIHAENDALIGWTKNRLIASGQTAPKHHALSHPRLAEIEAVNRMITFAEFFATPVMLFHISTREAVSAIRAAQKRRIPVWAETCPHYLSMEESVLDRPGIEGAKWMCSPPQSTPDDQAALWHSLADGTLSIVSSDHAPYRFDETGKLSAGDNPIFAQIANGLPGLETRMPLLFDAFMRGPLTAQEFVRATATNPAKIYGLQGKGDIKPGYDADLVVWNPETRHTYAANDLNDNVGYNPWEGRSVQGWPETVFHRGRAVVESGKVTPHQGQWLARDRIGVSPSISPSPEFLAATGNKD